MWENPMTYVGIGMLILWLVAYGLRFFKNWLSPVRTVKATVENKQKVEYFSKYSGNGQSTQYAVTFSAGEKRYSFYVSEFSYRGCRTAETTGKHTGPSGKSA